ncbi:MAG: hypothetical protein IJO80_00620 [Firmicutes bacterium]|nr:hypothetical protein [Bacillota bacterium]MBQ6841702.1 hypothetical protein [Bacillota bacterium]
MKKYLLIMMILLLAFSFCACGEKEVDLDTAVGGRTARLFGEVLNAESSDYYLRYSRIEDLGYGPEVVKYMQYYKGDMAAGDIESSMGDISFIIKDDLYYYIIHASMMYTVAEAGTQPSGFFSGDAQTIIKEHQFTSGTEVVNGFSYEYDATTIDGVESRFYYNGDGRLSYIESGDVLTTVLDYGTVVADKVFDLPLGYTEFKFDY